MPGCGRAGLCGVAHACEPRTLLAGAQEHTGGRRLGDLNDEDFGLARIPARTAAAMTGFGLKEPNRAELTQGSKTVRGGYVPREFESLPSA
jgi:hypothetical protein